MTVMSVLHLAEGLMASSAGGITKLLLSGSHIPSPKVYVNLQGVRRVEKTGEAQGIGLYLCFRHVKVAVIHSKKWQCPY